jgi:hypothetical protein
LYLARPKEKGKAMKKLLVSLIGAVLVIACGNDDDGLDVEIVPPRLLSEVAPENDEEILEFLQTHFYNYEDFQEPIDPSFDFRVRIDTIAGDNSGKTPLSQQVETLTLNVSSDQFNLGDDEEDVPHNLYYLQVREGEGDFPTVADSTLLKYEGSLLDGNQFDAVSDFFWQELPFFIRGFANGTAQLKSGTIDGLIVNADGTTQITNSGIGILFIPSGLAYFNSPPSTSIDAYDPLIFSVEVGLFIEDTDNDNDGIPSIMEDLNGDLDVFNDNTDNDIERENGLLLGVPNFRDTDDDGDGVLTREEISDENGNIIFPYPDSNNDGTPDYLDPDIQREVES